MRNTKQTPIYGALAAILVLTLAACGGGGGSGNRVNPAPNSPPVLAALALSAKQDTDVPGQVTASDPTGDALIFSVAGNPANGTVVSFTPAGAFVYRPAPGFAGDDSFRVQVTDAAGNTVTGTVLISVNAAPVLGALALTTKENTDVSGKITASDPTGEALTFTVAGSPTSGTVVSINPTGEFIYRPAPGFLGDVSLPVQVTDTAGNVVTGTVTINVHPNRVPVATNDALRSDGAALASIPVLINDTDADADPLTVEIAETPLVGTAAVNPDSTVSISALPSDFKGVTRFKYRVIDSSGAPSAVATVALFVGAEPFRVVFAGDPAANGSTEVFMSDFVTDAAALTSATEGNKRLRGFAVAENGTTVAYRREDQSTPSVVDLSFVRTSTPGVKTVVPLPVGATLPLDASNKDQFIVSPDGQWIALIARVTNADAIYVLNVASPATLTKVSPADTVVARQLRFSRDSRNLYFLAASVADKGQTLYTVTPATPTATVPVSAISDPTASEDVLGYSFSADQAAILVQANRAGRVGLFFIDARHLQTEVQLNQPLSGAAITASTVSLPGGTIGGALGGRVGYTVQTLSPPSKAVYVAEISATPNARLVAPGAEVVGLRPDDNALLYAKDGQIYEHDLAIVGSGTLVAVGGNAWYDSTGNIVLVQQFAGSAGYPVLAVTNRGAFGTTQPVGTPTQAARLSEVSGFDRGVALLAEGPPGGSMPSSARLTVVNGLAPNKLLYLSDFESPLQLTSATARVVSK